MRNEEHHDGRHGESHDERHDRRHGIILFIIYHSRKNGSAKGGPLKQAKHTDLNELEILDKYIFFKLPQQTLENHV